MGEVRAEIAAKLLYYRKKKGITQRQLAESIGVKHNSISAWEKAACFSSRRFRPRPITSPSFTMTQPTGTSPAAAASHASSSAWRI